MCSLIQIHDVVAVGMHHWGQRNLPVNGVFRLQAEFNNVADCNAVSINADDKPYTCSRKAYLSRESAKVMQPIIISYGHKVKSLKLEVNTPATIVYYRKGPQHYCTVKIVCQKEYINNIVTMIDGYKFEVSSLD